MSRKRGATNFEDPDYEKPHEVWANNYQPSHAGSQTPGSFIAGQRYASEMEPELGIGTVTTADHRRVTLSFQDNACIRQYSLESAPLRRITFRTGDAITTRTGTTVTIDALEEQNGLIVYICAGQPIRESDLSDSIRFTLPLDRLLSGHTDMLSDFMLRQRALDCKLRIDKSPIRGFIGGRIDCIPHQLYIAEQVASRHSRRILLADEVGLGKTIEACLIMHRLIVCGQASRVLVCVPQSIVHVWFVELLRKFNMIFRIVDSEFFETAISEGTNPFLDDQLILTDIGFLSGNEQAIRMASEAQWDIFIVDEAHHLRENTPELLCVKNISEQSRDVFFLTATPQQHGSHNHFDRLKLLDPSRYTDYNAFLQEAENHRAIAHVTGRILSGMLLDDKDKILLRELLGDRFGIFESGLANVSPNTSSLARKEIVGELLDRFGIGRAMFRNTRLAVGGFPKRQVVVSPLSASPSHTGSIQQELLHIIDKKDIGTDTLTYANDPRYPYFANLLKEFSDDKFLVICSSKETVKTVEKAILRHINVSIALFHEDLSLIQRDRNAAWFSETEGARILLCSEIGSEGRNFQFCRHLVMWDLPADCELVEQRIGRLDRIGQKRDVIIHVPYIMSTCGEVFARWFHEGVSIFSNAVPAAQEVFETNNQAILSIARAAQVKEDAWRTELDKLILSSQKQTEIVTKRLEQGRDRLLEQHSYRPKEASAIVDQILLADANTVLERFMIDLFKHSGVFSEPLNKRTYKLWSESSLDESFPALRTSRPVITFDRATALSREDMEFLTQDHPAVRSGLDMFLGSEKGNSCYAMLAGKETGLLLEAVFVIECIALPSLNVFRFLPPTPLRIIVDHTMKDKSDLYNSTSFESRLSQCSEIPLLDNPQVVTTIIPDMQKKAALFASNKSKSILEAALQEMYRIIGNEVDRLKSLSLVNKHISMHEIQDTENELRLLQDAINNATPRLDSVRLIWQNGTGR